MSTFKRVVISLPVCLIVLFSFMLPASAVAEVDYTLPINMGNPIDNGYDGYLSVPYRIGSDVYLEVVYWKFFRTSSPDDTSNNDVLVTVNFTSNNSFDVNFDYLGSDVIGVYCSSMSSQYNKHGLGSWNVVDYNDSVTLVFGVPSNAQFFYPQHYSPIYSITSNSVSGRPLLSSFPFYSYSIVWNNNDTFNQLSEVLNHLELMLVEATLTNDNFDELLTQFSYLLETAYNIDYSLSEFVFYYWNEFTLDTFPTSIYAITSRLDKIYKLLNEFEWGEITTSFSEDLVSEFDEVEGNINDNLDNPELESFFDGVQLDTSTGAFEFIWNLMTSCFNSHPEVMGLISVILTLGLIALILNR